MPGMPGGLVSLQQYLDANQPAAQRTQGELDTRALQPYQQALSGVTSQVQSAATLAAQQEQQAAQQQANQQSRQNAARGGAGVGTASVPYSGALADSPTAQATLQGAQDRLNSAAAQATKATADPSNRQNTLYSMYGGAVANGLGANQYSLGDAGLDSALTGATAKPAGAGSEVQTMIGAAPATPGTATATTTRSQNVENGPSAPGEGPTMKPRRTWDTETTP